jgi:hypothetical protein
VPRRGRYPTAEEPAQAAAHAVTPVCRRLIGCTVARGAQRRGPREGVWESGLLAQAIGQVAGS